VDHLRIPTRDIALEHFGNRDGSSFGAAALDYRADVCCVHSRWSGNPRRVLLGVDSSARTKTSDNAANRAKAVLIRSCFRLLRSFGFSLCWHVSGNSSIGCWSFNRRPRSSIASEPRCGPTRMSARIANQRSTFDGERESEIPLAAKIRAIQERQIIALASRRITRLSRVDREYVT